MLPSVPPPPPPSTNQTTSSHSHALIAPSEAEYVTAARRVRTASTAHAAAERATLAECPKELTTAPLLVLEKYRDLLDEQARLGDVLEDAQKVFFDAIFSEVAVQHSVGGTPSQVLEEGILGRFDSTLLIPIGPDAPLCEKCGTATVDVSPAPVLGAFIGMLSEDSSVDAPTPCPGGCLNSCFCTNIPWCSACWTESMSSALVNGAERMIEGAHSSQPLCSAPCPLCGAAACAFRLAKTMDPSVSQVHLPFDFLGHAIAADVPAELESPAPLHGRGSCSPMPAGSSPECLSSEPSLELVDEEPSAQELLDTVASLASEVDLSPAQHDHGPSSTCSCLPRLADYISNCLKDPKFFHRIRNFPNDEGAKKRKSRPPKRGVPKKILSANVKSPSSGLKTRRCGTCHQVGHYAPKCTAVV